MNPTILKKIGVVFAFLAGIIIGVAGAWLAIQNSTQLRYYLLERPTAKQPQAQVDAFVHALVRGDRSEALALWEVKGTNAEDALLRRQEQVLAELEAAEISSDYMILETEWWSTCCEPSVTCDARGAGGARLRVQFLDKAGDPLSYIFDIFTREQPYWGAAMGYPPREWVIRDVYPRGQNPLFWTRIYEPQIRSVHP